MAAPAVNDTYPSQAARDAAFTDEISPEQVCTVNAVQSTHVDTAPATLHQAVQHAHWSSWWSAV